MLFANFQIIKDRGKDDVGIDAESLCRRSVDSIEVLGGEFEISGVGRRRSGAVAEYGMIEAQHHLHRAFAVCGLIADDDRSSIVLQGGGCDFGCGRALAIDQNNERAVVCSLWIAIVMRLDEVARIAHLHHRASGEKQPRQLDRFFEDAASVVSEVQDDAIHRFALESLEDFPNVASGILVVLRELDHRQRARRALHADIARKIDDFGAGLTVF